MKFFCDASARNGNGSRGLQWYQAGYNVCGTTRAIIPYCIVSTNQDGRFLLITCLRLSIAAFLSEGSWEIYSLTVVAFDCILETTKRK